MVSSSERVAATMPRVALVTGGGKGIGAAVAHRLAADGFRVAVLGRDALALARVAKDIRGLAVEADVTDAEAMDARNRARREHARSRSPSPSPNAGHQRSASLASTDDATWERVMAVNATAPSASRARLCRRW